MGVVIQIRHARAASRLGLKTAGLTSEPASACEKARNFAGGMNPRFFQLLTADMPTPAKEAAAAGPPTAVITASTVSSIPGEYSRRVNLSTHHGLAVDCSPFSRFKTAMAETAKTIGNRLLVTREALGLKAAEVCRRIGCKANRWSQYESGERKITLPVANRLCDEYGLTLDWIYRADPARLPHELRLRMPRTAA